MATNLVFSDEDEEKFENLRGVYQRTFSEKTRAFIRKRMIYKFARGYLVAKEKTFFEDMPRKKFITRLFNNWAWTLKYNSVNTAYNRFGLDIKGFRKASDYLDFEYVKKDRAKIHHPVAIQIVNQGIAATGHSLLATLIPPAVSVGDVVGAISGFVG